MSTPTIKLYVGNVPVAARSSELKELFEKFGKVVECDILKEFAFVHMEDTNDAKAAIAGLNDTLWKGARIRVELSNTKTAKGERKPPGFRGGFNGPPMSRGGFRGGRGGGAEWPERRRFDSGPSPYGDERFPPQFGRPRGGASFGNGYGNGGGPMRERNFGGPPNGRMPDRGRPYPDSFEHRNGRGGGQRPSMPPRGGGGGGGYGGHHDFGGYPPQPMPPQQDDFRGPPGGGGGFNPRPSNGYRPGPPMNNFDFGGNFSGGDQFMRAPMPPGPPAMQNDYFRGPPMPQGPPLPPGPPNQRYNYDGPPHNGNGNFAPPMPPQQARGRYNNY